MSTSLQPSNNKPALVFIHYFGGAARSWNWTIEKLLHEYQVVALNLPGFGNTPPPQEPSIDFYAQYVLDEITSRRISNCVVIGHSMGGKIALKAATLDNDSRINKLILIAPSPPTTEPMDEEEKERMLNQNEKEAIKTVEKSTVIPLNKEKFDTAIQTQLEIDHKVWKWWINDGMANSIAGQVRTLLMPIAVFASEKDPVMTPDVIHTRVMEYLPDAELRTTIETGHLIPMEDLEWTAMMIKDYLNN